MPALQHGFTVEPTDDINLNRIQQRVKMALDKIAAAATASQLTLQGQLAQVGPIHVQGADRGPDVPSAGTIAARYGYQHVTGTTSVSYIATDGWFDGARIEIYLPNGLTFIHNAALLAGPRYRLLLAGLANLTLAAGQHIAFRRDDGHSFWTQVG